jgi:hypothetical protein
MIAGNSFSHSNSVIEALALFVHLNPATVSPLRLELAHIIVVKKHFCRHQRENHVKTAVQWVS